MTGSVVRGNRADHNGGGILFRAGTSTIRNSTIMENTGTACGGIGNESSSTITVTGTLFSKNSCTSQVNPTACSGGIRNAGRATVTNCTLSENSANTGIGGISNIGHLEISNTIVVENRSKIGDMMNTGSLQGNNNLVGRTTQADIMLYDPVKPLFVDAAKGDYRLAADSQAIDKGDNQAAYDAGLDKNSRDLAGNPRFVGESIDIGAYEFQREETPP